ncbi:MAG TPA: class I SAM-dependent methyltransferase [Methylomirabilota bacterium]|nr:class I SAM-dependent methyltransferase [Methylomirabilota bacterium]
MKNYLKKSVELIRKGVSSPKLFDIHLKKIPWRIKSNEFVSKYREHGASTNQTAPGDVNPLEQYFDSHKEGRGIWKWRHYFDIYHRHFSKFVGQRVNLLEIGIFSGGSLDMWRSYLGDQCHIHGVDIKEECKCYENEYTTVHIGDQTDRNFWKKFRDNNPPIDILVDDGGHTAEQQRITLEEMLPHLRCGGVYLCEDVQGRWNSFAAYASSLVDEFNNLGELNEFQKSIHSIHFYPFCVVIEKHKTRPERFVDARHGTEWQPYYDKLFEMLNKRV